MSARTLAILYLIGMVFTVVVFQLAIKHRNKPLKNQAFFWALCSLLWPAMWGAVLIAYIFDGREEPDD